MRRLLTLLLVVLVLLLPRGVVGQAVPPTLTPEPLATAAPTAVATPAPSPTAIATATRTPTATPTPVPVSLVLTWTRDLGLYLAYGSPDYACLWVDDAPDDAQLGTLVDCAVGRRDTNLLRGNDIRRLPLPGRWIVLRSPAGELARAQIPRDPFGAYVILPLVVQPRLS